MVLYDSDLEAQVTYGSLFDNDILLSETNRYYFPFDRRSIDMAIWLDASMEGENGESTDVSIAPDITGWVDAPDWDESVSIDKIYSEELGHEVTRLHIDFHRPLAYRALTIILLGTLFAFIVALVFVKDTGSFLEVAVGVLLGLWGIQDILIPAGVTWPTIIDPLILTLYVSFAFVTLVRFGVRPVWHWLSDRLEPEAPQKVSERPPVRISRDVPAEKAPNTSPSEPQIPSKQPLSDARESTDLHQIISLMLLGTLTLIAGLLFFRQRKREE